MHDGADTVTEQDLAQWLLELLDAEIEARWHDIETTDDDYLAALWKVRAARRAIYRS